MVDPRPGHSVLTEPIGSVLRFLNKFGSYKTGTVWFFLGVRTEEFRVRFLRFGSSYNRWNRTPTTMHVAGCRRCGRDRRSRFARGGGAPAACAGDGERSPGATRAGGQAQGAGRWRTAGRAVAAADRRGCRDGAGGGQREGGRGRGAGAGSGRRRAAAAAEPAGTGRAGAGGGRPGRAPGGGCGAGGGAEGGRGVDREAGGQ